MTQFIGLFPGGKHGRNRIAVQRADIDDEAAADGRDLRCIVDIVSHDRAAAAGKQHV